MFESYRGIVQGHLIPSLGTTRLARLSPDQLQAYLNFKSTSGLSPNTVRNHRSVLRRALNQAERWGLVQRNVARLVTPPRVQREEVRPPSAQEARALLAALEGHRLETAFQLAIGLGMRQGEILGLTWEAVDLELRTIRVERSLQRYGGEYHLDEVKTAKSRRRLGMPIDLADQLRARRLQQLEERLRAGPAWVGNAWDLVFTTEAGTPVDAKYLRRVLARSLEAAELPPQRFHDLRHAAASFMLAEGVALRVAQEVLGHSTIAVTADIYSHLAPGATYDATERVGALLRRNPEPIAVRIAVNEPLGGVLAPAATPD